MYISEQGIVYLDLAFKANWPLQPIKAKKGQNSVLSPANNCFRRGEAELHISNHQIVHQYLASEANWPFGPIKTKKGRQTILSPANNCFRRGKARLRISEHGKGQHTILSPPNNCRRSRAACIKTWVAPGHAAPPEELEYTREAGVF